MVLQTKKKMTMMMMMSRSSFDDSLHAKSLGIHVGYSNTSYVVEYTCRPSESLRCIHVDLDLHVIYLHVRYGTCSLGLILRTVPYVR